MLWDQVGILLHQYFLIRCKSFIQEYYTIHWIFNNVLVRKRTPFRPVSHNTWFLDCHKYCLNKILILCTFLCTNILNWPLNLHDKKALPCQNTDKNHWSNGILKRSKSKCKIASDPMANRHRQNDSTLTQWCWRIQWGRQSYPYHSWSQPCSNVAAVPALIGAPSSWWSLPMPRNGTD